MNPSNQFNQRKAGTAFASLGIVLLLASAAPPLCMFAMALWPSQGNSFGSNGLAVVAAGISVFIVSLPFVVIGLILVRRFSSAKRLHLVGWIVAAPTVAAVACVAFFAACAMRPITTYDPQDYQHLVGQNLEEVSSKLDTRHAVNSYGGGAYHTLSLRGMKIDTDRDGKIVEVKKRH